MINRDEYIKIIKNLEKEIDDEFIKESTLKMLDDHYDRHIQNLPLNLGTLLIVKEEVVFCVNRNNKGWYMHTCKIKNLIVKDLIEFYNSHLIYKYKPIEFIYDTEKEIYTKNK